MTNPEQSARQLQDLADWAPLLTDTTATLTSPRASGAHTNARGTPRDLGDLIAPTIDAEDEGAYAIRTHAQITTWATHWATTANLTYTGNPLHALADNTQRLASEWNDWEAFADDLAILHTRIARVTGHAPRIIGPCPEDGCHEDVTQAMTSRGADGPIECSRGHTYMTLKGYEDAMRAADRSIAQHVTDLDKRVTIAQFLVAWPELTKDDVKNWTRAHGDKPPRLPKDASGQINLAAANLLARRLVEGREKRGTPNRLANQTITASAGLTINALTIPATKVGDIWGDPPRAAIKTC